jgi:hypothetical protein
LLQFKISRNIKASISVTSKPPATPVAKKYYSLIFEIFDVSKAASKTSTIPLIIRSHTKLVFGIFLIAAKKAIKKCTIL